MTISVLKSGFPHLSQSKIQFLFHNVFFYSIKTFKNHFMEILYIKITYLEDINILFSIFQLVWEPCKMSSESFKQRHVMQGLLQKKYYATFSLRLHQQKSFDFIKRIV